MSLSSWPARACTAASRSRSSVSERFRSRSFFSISSTRRLKAASFSWKARSAASWVLRASWVSRSTCCLRRSASSRPSSTALRRPVSASRWACSSSVLGAVLRALEAVAADARAEEIAEEERHDGTDCDAADPDRLVHGLSRQAAEGAGPAARSRPLPARARACRCRHAFAPVRPGCVPRTGAPAAPAPAGARRAPGPV